MSGVRQEGILQVDDVGGGGGGVNVTVVDPIGPNLAAASVSVTLATDESPIDVILPDVTVVGTITAMSQSVGVDTNGYATATFQITGTWDDQLRLEATVNGIDFEIVIGRLLDLTIYSSISENITANNTYVVACSGYSHVRLKSYAYVSGTVEITAIANATSSTQPYAAHQGITGNPLTPWYTTRPDLRRVGTLENPSDVIDMELGNANHGNYGTVTYQISGTWVATIGFSGTSDESNYVTVPVYDLATGALVPSSQITANGFYLIASAGFSFIRAEAIAHTSGTVQVTGIASAPINPLTFPKDVTIASAIDANIVSPLGANVAANSVSVTLATDEAPIPTDIKTTNGAAVPISQGVQALAEVRYANPIRTDATLAPLILDGSGKLKTTALTITELDSTIVNTFINDGDDLNAGATTDSAVVTDTIGTLSGKLRGLVKWAFERMPASLGQKVMAQSLPVTLSSDQSAINVAVSSSVLPTGAATDATLSDLNNKFEVQPSITLQNAAVANGDGTILTLNGANALLLTISGTGGVATILNFEQTEDSIVWKAVRASQPATGNRASVTTVSSTSQWLIPVVGAVSFRARISNYDSGAITVTTRASWGNAKFTDIFSLIADQGNSNFDLTNPWTVQISDGAAELIGQRNMAGSIPVAIASDQSAITVSTKTDLTPSAPTVASVGVASAQAVAAAATRKGLIVRNLSNARISLGFGSAAVLDRGVTLYPRDTFEMDEYDFDLGAINAIASAAASNLAIQEFTT